MLFFPCILLSIKEPIGMQEIYIFLLTYFLHISSADLIVNTNSGPIQGILSAAEDVEAYLGIPYAEPPVDELRFARPVSKSKWTEVYDASNLPPPCTQIGLDREYYFMPDISSMSEDCLYLNIWAPKPISMDSLKPVIIFIHPGAFVSGSSNLKAHDGSHLASRGNLVIATINYRLGSFGFFLAHTEEANGNMGIFDQIMAIKWVKENAKHFGGDPENIILMGASAGAYSVSLHMVSPLSKGLFRRAIIQSGSAIHPFFMDDNAALYQNSQLVAELVGCTNDTMTLKTDPKSVISCLKLKPKDAFTKAEKNLVGTKPALFYPRVNDEFLPNSSVSDFFRTGNFRKNIDVLIGFTKEEGTLLIMAALPEFFGNYGQNYANDMSKIRSLTFSRAMLMSMEQPNASEITSFYSSQVKNRTSAEYMKMLANIFGDFTIACGTVFLADYLSAKTNSLYFYKFDFHTSSSPMADWIGTTHLDDIQYVFGNPYHDNFTTKEVELSHRLMDRWSAFAWTGNPNIPRELPWFKYSYDKPLYINFGQEEESIRMRPNDRCEIWRKRFDSDIDCELIHFLRNSAENIIMSKNK